MTPSGKCALITGASSGIGRELATLFARDGYDLILVARDRAALARIGDELTHVHGVTVDVITRDLSRPDAAVEVYRELKRRSIKIDALVNNAGFGTYGPFADGDAATEGEMLQLNIVALTQLTRLFLKDMLAKGEGRILNVASTAAFQPGPLMAVYYASKAYVLSFSEALANELRDFGVTVSALCPGPTQTGFRRRARMEDSRLFESGVMDATTVAAIGYRGLTRGRTVIIPGMKNRLLALAVRFAPRRLVTSVVRRLQDRAGAVSPS
jgi:short-subunit dehydrogenase